MLSGLVTVRAYGQSSAYENLMFDRVDAFQGYDHVSPVLRPLGEADQLSSSVCYLLCFASLPADVHQDWSGVFYIRGRFDAIGAFAIGLLTLVALRLNISQGLAAFTLVSAQTFTTSIHELIWYGSLC